MIQWRYCGCTNSFTGGKRNILLLLKSLPQKNLLTSRSLDNKMEHFFLQVLILIRKQRKYSPWLSVEEGLSTWANCGVSSSRSTSVLRVYKSNWFAWHFTFILPSLKYLGEADVSNLELTVSNPSVSLIML